MGVDFMDHFPQSTLETTVTLKHRSHQDEKVSCYDGVCGGWMGVDTKDHFPQSMLETTVTSNHSLSDISCCYCSMPYAPHLFEKR